MLSALFEGCELSPVVMIYFRKKLLARELTPAIVEGYRRTV